MACTYTTPDWCDLAVLPVGYCNGYSRLFSNRGEVLIHGRRAPIRGRVCMNLTMVDVTGISAVKEGDRAVFFGPGPGRPVARRGPGRLGPNHQLRNLLRLGHRQYQALHRSVTWTRKPDTREASICLVCAWRETCVKKYSFTGQHCLEYTRDMTLKAKPWEKRRKKGEKG